MLFKSVWLVALLCCTAALETQQSDCDCGDCDCQINYKWASVITRDTSSYGPATFFAVRPNDRNASALSWTVQVAKKLQGSRLTVTYEVFKQINECWIPVLKQCDFPFCETSTPEVLSHVVLTGLLNCSPPITGCPIEPGQYELSNFIPELRQLDNNVVAEDTLIDYEVKDNGKPILNVRLWLEIKCAK